MPPQGPPAASLGPASRLPAGRMLIRVGSPLIYRVLCAIWRVISVAGSVFLPELREKNRPGHRNHPPNRAQHAVDQRAAHPDQHPAGREATGGPEGGSRGTLGRHGAPFAATGAWWSSTL